MPIRLLTVLLLLGALGLEGQSLPMPGPGLPFPRKKSKQAEQDQQQLDTLKGTLRYLAKDEIGGCIRNGGDRVPDQYTIVAGVGHKKLAVLNPHALRPAE